MFRARGLKVTPQRQSIFRALHASDERHPTADAVFAAARAEMPSLSLKTVYQTLNDLVEMGLVAPLDLGTGATRFDPNADGHHHAVCTVCGSVRDVYLDASPLELPIADLDGFAVSHADVVVRGRCRSCLTGTEPT